MKIEVLTPTIEQGNIGSSGNYDSTSRVRSKDYLYFENIAAPVKSVTITAQSTSNKTILVDLLGYTSNSTSSPTFDLYWYENGHVFDVTEYNAVKYFRVVLKYEDNSDISPSEIISVSVNLSYGYKWIQGADGHPVPGDAPDLPEKAMTKPYPLALWRIDDGKLKTGLTPDIEELGAFCHATKLTKVSIPTTCKHIGEFAFRFTSLKSVKLPEDCEYYSTSFPEGCVVSGGILIDTKKKLLSSWRGARAFTWREISKFKWKEVSKNGGENNES